MILVIDDHSDFFSQLVSNLKSSDFASLVGDVGSAKRRMLKEKPVLIFAQATFAADPGAGLRLCRDLHDHGGFRDIPVVLLLKALSPDAERFAREAGARALLSEPWKAQTIRQVVERLAPTYLSEATPVHPNDPLSEVREQKPASALPLPQASTALGAIPDDFERNLEVAQGLLKRIFEHLQASDVIRVIDAEDVPRVLMEAARAVLQIKK